MPRVALVYPYFRTRAPTELLFSPLGVAYLASQFHNLGIEARIFDCTFSNFPEIRASLLAYKPEVVGIYSMVTLSRNTFQIAEMVRLDLSNCLLVAGGPLPTLYPDRFIGAFDAVFRGEVDLSFPQFCQDFFQLLVPSHRGKTVFPSGIYNGLYAFQNGSLINHPPVHHPEGLMNSFPLPYRGDFDHVSYQREGILRNGARTTSIITTYGCPFNCDFCSKPVFGNLFRRRNLRSVFEEIDEITRLGYDSLWIADDNFTLDLDFLKEFCRRITGRNIKWSCLSRVTSLNIEIANLMKAAGCQKVYLGIESGSQETLNLMNKKASVEDACFALGLFKEAGIQVSAFFIVGYPGETVSTIEETFRIALAQPFDEISFNVPFPLPGSKLYERVSGLNKDSDWDKENEVTFVYHSEFDEGWLRRRIEETIRAFSAKA